MSEALESISPRPVGPLTPLAPAAGPDGVGGGGRGRERSPFAPASRAGQNDGQESGPAGLPDLADSLSLSPEAQQQLRELKLRDAEVRAHESAHMAAGGGHVNGGAGYTYQKGPDGRQYAIGGHVSIDASSVPGDPEASREKAQQVRRAALAPGEPSGQDRQVAARAATWRSWPEGSPGARAARRTCCAFSLLASGSPGTDEASMETWPPMAYCRPSGPFW